MQQALEVNPQQLSTLEKDLILHYLRELYQIYAHAEAHALPIIKPMAEVPVPEKQTEKEVVQKSLEFKFESESHPAPEPVKPVEPVMEKKHSVVDAMPEIKTEVMVNPFLPPTTAHGMNTPSSPAHDSVAQTSSVKVNSSTVPVSIQELFDIKKGTDLSEKLNDLPLKDINRALGLNDRLEIIKTLFGGNKALFDQTIVELNALKSFEDAELLLGTGVAIQFKWDHEEKNEKAIDFIKLIRRRYL